MVTSECQGCGEKFEASRLASWCSDRCRKRSKRAQEQRDPVQAKADVDPEALDRHALVRTTCVELEKAGALESFNGQLALQLARRLANPDESGISALSKELRTVMTAALAGAEALGPSVEEPDASVEDEVEAARRKREEARQAAGLG